MQGPFVTGRGRKGRKPDVSSGEENQRKLVRYRSNPWRTGVALFLARSAACRLIKNVCKLTWYDFTEGRSDECF
jgi:hypothetical protein